MSELIKKTKDTQNLFTKQWIELTLCNLTDDVIAQDHFGGSQEDIMKIIRDYANQIFIIQKCDNKNKKNLN